MKKIFPNEIGGRNPTFFLRNLDEYRLKNIFSKKVLTNQFLYDIL